MISPVLWLLISLNLIFYWADWGVHTIERSSFNGTNRSIIVDSGLGPSLGIALDTENNKMYWAKQGGIVKSNLDGTEKQVLFEVEDGYPTGLGIDLVDGKLYWTDPRKNTIERSNLDGSGIRGIYQR